MRKCSWTDWSLGWGLRGRVQKNCERWGARSATPYSRGKIFLLGESGSDAAAPWRPSHAGAGMRAGGRGGGGVTAGIPKLAGPLRTPPDKATLHSLPPAPLPDIHCLQWLGTSG